jgi:assimilatory nitrate reductase catalytic subunit
MVFADDDIDRVRRFWNAPAIARREGLKAVQMFEAIADGRIKALWVMGTNPAVSLPNADAVKFALARLDFLVVSDNVVSNDTINAGAHLLLPALGWGEKSGTVTNSERRISRQRAFLETPGRARPDWWIITEVARRMGFAAEFSYHTPADIFCEHAALSTFENGGTRDFDIGTLATLSNQDYDALKPVQWPIRAVCREGVPRLFGDGRFFHPNRRARVVAIAPPELQSATSAAFPFRLNTGRIRDQWHTMTRTGLAPRLSAHLAEPFVAIHPDDAHALGLSPDGFARVTSALGSCILKVACDERLACGEVFAPIHWSDETASHARIGALIAPCTDPFSGQPEAKATPVAIAPVAYASRGFVLSRNPLAMPPGTWWARTAVGEGIGYLFASNEVVIDWRAFFFEHAPTDDVIEYRDDARCIFRAASFVDGRLHHCLFIETDNPHRAWEALKDVMMWPAFDPDQRRLLLSGLAFMNHRSDGPVVCACHGVGARTIREAIARIPDASVETIGEMLKAGTGCGSCIPEIRRMISAPGPVNPARYAVADALE